MAGAKVGLASRTNAVSPVSSLYHSHLAPRWVSERASSDAKPESLLANRSGLWEEATLEIENSVFRHLENQKLLCHSARITL